MRASLSLSLSLSLLLTAVACTRYLPRTSLPQRVDEEVVVQILSGDEIDAVVEVHANGLALRDADTGKLVPIEQVVRVVDRRPGRGALQGFGTGFAVLGTLAFVMTGGDTRHRLMVAGLGGVLGGVLTLPIGAFLARDEYAFQRAPAQGPR